MSGVASAPRGRSIWWTAPAFAHPRVVGRIPGALATAGGILALFLDANQDAISDGAKVTAYVVSIGTILLGCEMLVFGAKIPRWSFHLIAVLGTAIATTQVYLFGATPTGHQFVLHYFFVTTAMAFFFSWGEALIQVTIAAVGAIWALHHIDMSWLLILDTVGSFVAISAIVAWVARLADQADRDVLTDLGNARHMANSLERAVAESRRTGAALSLLMIGIDHMAELNARRGFSSGNDLLVACADSWSRLVPDRRLLNRYSGDEFAVVLPGFDLLDAVRLAEQIREHCPAALTVSIGAASLGATDSWSTLTNRSFVALHEAKSLGRDRVASYGDSQLIRELDEAIDRGDLFMLYQPVVRLSDNQIASREALVRWQHPVRGLISPVDFIAEAERSGLIHKLGAWTLEQACRTTARHDGVTKVAVNVSVMELRSPGYVERVHDVLHRTGLEPTRLIVEVTEGVSDQFDEHVTATLTDLRSLGIKIAIDDFGSGYSSLRWVADFPVDILKIDGTFVRNIEEGADSTPILEAIVYMGWSLGLAVVAEHVESEHQAHRLRKLGCDYAQGYLFGRPGPIETTVRVADTEATA